MNFEQNFEVISENIDEIGELYEQLEGKCNDWKERFKEHDIDYCTFSSQNDTVERDDRCLYVDPFGHVDFTAPNESNDYYEPYPFNVRRPSDHHQCRFIGRHRRNSPSKKKNSSQSVSYIFMNPGENGQEWKNQFERELQNNTHIDISNSEIHAPTMKSVKMKKRTAKSSQKPKAKLVSHGNQQGDNVETHYQTARQRSNEIFNETWQEKENIRAKRQQPVPYTRNERAFVAVSTTTEGEIEQDEEKAKVAAIELSLKWRTSMQMNASINNNFTSRHLPVNWRNYGGNVSSVPLR
jgi:hypothetical protein